MQRGENIEGGRAGGREGGMEGGGGADLLNLLLDLAEFEFLLDEDEGLVEPLLGV